MAGELRDLVLEGANLSQARQEVATVLERTIEQYTAEDIRREYHTPKACAPYCTIGCVHRASEIDNKYRQPLIKLGTFARASAL